MSQGSDNAPAQPVDQVQPGTPAAPDPALQPAPEPELTDPDLIELRDAKAAAEAEEAVAGAPGTEQASGTPAAQTPPAVAGDQQPPAALAAKAVTVPKPRFDQVLKERDEAREQAAYHRGVAEARAQPGQTPAGQQPTPPAQTPEQRLAGIDAEIDVLAKKFDDGEIAMSDFKKQERALQTRERAIREEALLAKVPQPKANEGGGDTLYLDDVTTQLLGQHPWVNVFDQVGTPKDWAYLEAAARDRIVERGHELAPGALGSATLRREMAVVADELGPVLLATRAHAKGIALPGQPSPQPAQRPQQPAAPQRAPLSDVAQNRLAKLDRQSNAPPALAAMSGSDGAVHVPDSSVENMTDDQIAALPAATRARILSKTA